MEKTKKEKIKQILKGPFSKADTANFYFIRQGRMAYDRANANAIKHIIRAITAILTRTKSNGTTLAAVKKIKTFKYCL